MEYITNRAQSDVDRVKYLRSVGWNNMTDDEKTEWSSDMIGAYNSSDLNRVESGVKRVSEEVGIVLDTKTDWSASDIPSLSDMQRYLDNVFAIRQKVVIPDFYPMPTRTIVGFDYKKANELELSLQRCEETVNAVFRCGEIYMGEW